MKPGLELYGAPTGNCRRAAIALEEAGIPYTVRHVDLRNGEHKRPPYLDLNPAGVVPTMVEHGAGGGSPLVLTQSNAIIFHAAEKAPERLWNMAERSVVTERFFYFLTDVIGPSQASFFLRNQGAQDAALLLDERLRAAIVAAERFAAGSRFIAGESFSIADILAYTITAFTKDSLPWEQLPNLKRWFDEIDGRSGVQRGLRAFDQPT